MFRGSSYEDGVRLSKKDARKKKRTGAIEVPVLLVLRLAKRAYIFFMSILAAPFACRVPMCKSANHFPLRFAQIVECRS